VRLRELIEQIPPSRGLLPDEEQIDQARASVMAALWTLEVDAGRDMTAPLLRQALDHLVGREEPSRAATAVSEPALLYTDEELVPIRVRAVHADERVTLFCEWPARDAHARARSRLRYYGAAQAREAERMLR
jgi:hypothetical protein